ncbi:MAG TPA: Rad52/Rad22 family DNA repair protein [Stellaceae bacterium]|nr:Rad52/Rad22 family DNA repair protein [Stellaceae bacterium]
MAFTRTQIRKLAGKLPERFVKTRIERAMTLSYIEGWHVIDEANRVFGFDGWDRETVSADCVWQDFRQSPKACSYAVRVRIKVRAGRIMVAREGTGVGHGTGATLGEAHESALKEAETDATKRALVTFGNLFGLALYDKEQAGVQRAKANGRDAPVVWTLIVSTEPPRPCETPQQFCSAAKEILRQAKSVSELEALWTGNAPAIAQLRSIRPELRTSYGTHYADVLESLYRQQRSALEQQAVNPQTAEASTADKSDLAIAMPKRVRNSGHLKYVSSLACLVCGRTPGHAHHLRFVQPRSLGSKPSDEWTVPLCPIHHRSLHDASREEEWWQAKGIDAKAEAERLWQTTHAPAPGLVQQAAATEAGIGPLPAAATGPAEPPGTPPTDSQGQPLPVNLHSGAPRLS